MLDAVARHLIDPPLNAIGARLAARGVTANQVTIVGFVLGIAALPAIATGQFGVAAALVAANRIADGLDGAVARQTETSDLGGYLDIVGDFIFYSAVPFGFALAMPSTNAVPAAFLIFSFVGTGSSFLTYAIVAAKRGLSTELRGAKSFYYLGGLTEGTETIAVFLAMCLFPQAFWWLAWVFGALCWITTATRIAAAWIAFRQTEAGADAVGPRDEAGP